MYQYGRNNLYVGSFLPLKDDMQYPCILYSLLTQFIFLVVVEQCLNMFMIRMIYQIMETYNTKCHYYHQCFSYLSVFDQDVKEFYLPSASLCATVVLPQKDFPRMHALIGKGGNSGAGGGG